MRIHASLQTDFSYYLPWLSKRLSEGYFDRIADNNHINRYIISNPETVFLHTKNPESIYKQRYLIEKLPISLICWVSMLDSFYEPNKKTGVKTFDWIRACTTAFPTYAGYGPMFYNQDNTMESHLAHFGILCRFLGLRIKGIYVNFNINKRCQESGKLNCRALEEQEKLEILEEMRKISTRYNLDIYIKPDINELPSDEIDLGEKNGCPEGCLYCTGITNSSIYKQKFMSHNSDSSMLFGKPIKGQKIIKVRPEPPSNGQQMSIFGNMI